LPEFHGLKALEIAFLGSSGLTIEGEFAGKRRKIKADLETLPLR